MAENFFKIGEYFFEYIVERIEDIGNNSLAKPILRFERDYKNTNLAYSLFVIAPEWANTDKSKKQSDIISGLPYNTVKICYDISDFSCLGLTNQSTAQASRSEIKPKSFSYATCCNEGCRMLVESGDTKDHSGVGVIEYYKDENLVARFFYAVNFFFRHRIDYTLVKKGRKLKVHFHCDKAPHGIEVVIASCENRIPCLKEDMVNGIRKTLVFSEKGEADIEIKLEKENATSDKVFSLGFANDNFVRGTSFNASSPNRFYLLNCISNNTLNIPPEIDLGTPVYKKTCPYCHRVIEHDSKYCCDDGVGPFVKIKNTKGYDISGNCMYCVGDTEMESGLRVFRSNYGRLLPNNFLSHPSFKVVLTGTPRAGKTLFLTRFFGIKATSQKSCAIDPYAIRNGLGKMGLDVNYAGIPAVKSEDGYIVDSTEWTNNTKYYYERAVGVYPKAFPKPTPEEKDTQIKSPFVLQVNRGENSGYISFYDVAGETAKTTNEFIKKINGSAETSGVSTGVFCFINADPDTNNNSAISEVKRNLAGSNLDPNVPVAVILSKMDTMESELDSNAMCLRTDYYRRFSGYDGSEAKRMIDISSEEIRSYLVKKNRDIFAHDQNTEKKITREGIFKEDEKLYFKNIKYFGTSSFDDKDCIDRSSKEGGSDNADEEGVIRYEVGSKHLDLPILWLCKQFDLINK